MAEQETIADVIAAMRDEAARADMEQDYSINDAAEMMREFAWRFEAAHKRELARVDAVIDEAVHGYPPEDINDKRERGEAVTGSNQFGNAAKLREALAELVENIEMRSSTFGLNVIVDTKTYLDAKAALAAPPRNCDRPECATTKAAQDVWRREDGGKTAYYEWLLATYKEGGNDGK